jgi:hypothetical protein
MHLRTFPDHQKHFFKNDFFDLQECLKTCFDAFAHTSRPPVTFFNKDIFDRQEWLKTCFDAFAHTSRPPETFFKKDIFYRLEWLKNVLMHLHMLTDHQ